MVPWNLSKCATGMREEEEEEEEEAAHQETKDKEQQKMQDWKKSNGTEKHELASIHATVAA